jgi:hypothetical protein
MAKAFRLTHCGDLVTVEAVAPCLYILRFLLV